MYLKEIFDQLSDGELNQTNLGVITEDKWPRVINQVNLGLADLFKRFYLREGRLMLQLLPYETSYPLVLSYAAANTKSKVAIGDRFILDSPQAKFTGDVLKVESVFTAAGDELVMNDGGNRWAIHATDTAPVTLQVPADIVNQVRDLPDHLKTETLQVVYRARHPKIDIEAAGFDPETYDVRLPDSHLQALLYYIASRVLGISGTGQNEGVTSVGYWKRYESECAQLLQAGVQLDRNAGFDKLRDRGFV